MNFEMKNNRTPQEIQALYKKAEKISDSNFNNDIDSNVVSESYQKFLEKKPESFSDFLKRKKLKK